MDVNSNLTYGMKEYPMRFIFVRSDGKINRDSKRSEQQRAQIDSELTVLQETVGMPYYRDAQKLKVKSDKLCPRYKEGKHLQIELLTSDDGKAISLDYTWDKESLYKEARLDGVYLLGTALIFHPLETVLGLFKEQP